MNSRRASLRMPIRLLPCAWNVTLANAVVTPIRIIRRRRPFPARTDSTRTLVLVAAESHLAGPPGTPQEPLTGAYYPAVMGLARAGQSWQAWPERGGRP